MKYFDGFGKEVTATVQNLIAENKALKAENAKLTAKAERKVKRIGKSKID